MRKRIRTPNSIPKHSSHSHTPIKNLAWPFLLCRVPTGDIGIEKLAINKKWQRCLGQLARHVPSRGW